MSDREVVGAALLDPGFGAYNVVWRLTVDREGLMRQEVRTWNYQKSPRDEFLYGDAMLDTRELAAVVSVAERVGFRNLSEAYEDYKVTDQETLWLAVRFGTHLKTVQAYAPVWLAAREKQEMIAFLELWGSIHRFAPFPSPYNDPKAMVDGVAKIQALTKQ
jgi:hypothetical protein